MRTQRVSSLHPPGSAERPSAAATALDRVLRQARRLHRAAQSGPLLLAMPALRRAHAAGVFPGRSLIALYRERQQLQRKHFLRTLAIEAGHPDWEHYRPALATMPPHAVDPLELPNDCHAFLNHWFSTEAEAREHARQHGGAVHRVGTQAVVVAAEAQTQTQTNALAAHDA